MKKKKPDGGSENWGEPMSRRPLNIALAGVGNVGGGLLEIFDRHLTLVEARSNRPLRIIATACRNAKPTANCLAAAEWFKDPMKFFTLNPKPDVVVELIGGSEGIALQLARRTLSEGIHLVTANKAMVAVHGKELLAQARKSKAILACEAAVAGGIPAIKTICEGMVGNEMESISGILNGTCNYVLTTMESGGRTFAAALQDAQKHGYAEADPAFDISGMDAAHKLAILAALAWGGAPQLEGINIEGIEHIDPKDTKYAAKIGYRIRHLAVARMNDGGLERRVQPRLLAEGAELAQVGGVFNAILAEGSSSGPLFLKGRGAGGLPTASAVMTDLVDISANENSGGIAFCSKIPPPKFLSPQVSSGRYYLRIYAVDRPGVLAQISGLLGEKGISMESMFQYGHGDSNEGVDLVMTTHHAEEHIMRQALHSLESLQPVLELPTMIRIQD